MAWYCFSWLSEAASATPAPTAAQTTMSSQCRRSALRTSRREFSAVFWDVDIPGGSSLAAFTVRALEAI